MTPKAADGTFKIRFLRKVKSDADTKLKENSNYNNGSTQERKFNFVKKFLHGIISGSTQEKIHPRAKPFQRAGGY